MPIQKFLVLSLVGLSLLLCLSSKTHAQNRTVDLHAKEIYELQTRLSSNSAYFWVKVSDIVTATADVKTKCVDKTDSSLLMVYFYSTPTPSFLFSHVLAAYLNKKQIFVAIKLPSTATANCEVTSFSTR